MEQCDQEPLDWVSEECPRLFFDEGQGITVNDRSWTWNGGQAGNPVSDYNNNGKMVGTARWNLVGLRGKSL